MTYSYERQAAGPGDLEKPTQDVLDLSRDLYRLVGRLESAARRMKSTRPELALAVLKQVEDLDRRARRLSMDIDEALGL